MRTAGGIGVEPEPELDAISIDMGLIVDAAQLTELINLLADAGEILGWECPHRRLTP